MTQVRTRFAPSPTGLVHIGNIRAAIYNWLFACHEGGQFLLRIEDTDCERSTPAAVQAVLDAIAWLPHTVGTRWGTKQYLDPKRLHPVEAQAAKTLAQGYPWPNKLTINTYG